MILGVFVVEAILKFLALGLDYFLDSWNVFDFSILSLTISILIIEKVAADYIGETFGK